MSEIPRVSGGSGREPIWFITGASSGLGRSVAMAALQRGDRVALAGREIEPLQSLANHFPDTAIAVAADVRDALSVDDAVSIAVDRFGGLDVVYNNAGYGLFGGIEEASDEEARAIFDTNVFGVLNVLRSTLPVLRAQHSGHVLQGSSFYGQMAHAGVGMLAATKYAVEGLSDALAAELAPLGVKLTLVEPAPMATPFLTNLAFASTISDYDVTVREVQRSLGELPPGSGVNPDRAAAGVLAAVDAAVPPLRLALGGDAETTMRAALTARLDVLDQWVGVTRSVDGSSLPI